MRTYTLAIGEDDATGPIAECLDDLANYAAGDRVTADDDLAIACAEVLAQWHRTGEVTDQGRRWLRAALGAWPV